MLQCYIISHRLDPYTKWSVIPLPDQSVFVLQQGPDILQLAYVIMMVDTDAWCQIGPRPSAIWLKSDQCLLNHITWYTFQTTAIKLWLKDLEANHPLVSLLSVRVFFQKDNILWIMCMASYVLRKLKTPLICMLRINTWDTEFIWRKAMSSLGRINPVIPEYSGFSARTLKKHIDQWSSSNG